MISPQLAVQCYRKKTAPQKMYRGSATTDSQFSYFMRYGSNSVIRYQWSTEKWDRLPSCPYHNSALVIINGDLTAVGGWDGSDHYSNKLITLQQKKWENKYPPMNYARSSAAVVSACNGEYIISIGGCVGGGHWTTSVELFQVFSRRWYNLTDLPQPLPYPSATVCGNLLYLIGDDIAYSCSLLLSSDRPITTQTIPHVIWTSLPRLPITDATAGTLSHQLLINGGLQGSSPVNSIYQLLDGRWVKIGSMSRGRALCLVVSQSPGRMMIVGGMKDSLNVQDIVEDCVIA